MRRLMYLTMGFAAACGSCAYIDSIIGKGMACMIMLVLLCMIDRKHAFVRKMIPSVLGCLLGFFWFSGFHIRYVEPILPLNEQTLPLSIRAADYGKNGQYGTSFDGTLEISGRTYQIQVRLQEEVAVEPGMVFSGNFYLRANVGGIHAGQGIFLSAYQRDELTVTESEEQWPDRIVKLRRDILQDLEDVFPEDTRAFAGALFLGDTSGLEYDVDTNLKVSGIRHVVAVSGLHISILFGILSMITFRRRFLTAFVGYPVLFFFAALTGFTPSVVRACLMSGLMLLANVLDREYDGPTSLSVAVLIMLVINPLMITDVGFQLSVSSVAGIFLFSPGIVKWLGSFVGDGKGKSLRRRLLRGMIGSVSVTLGATVFTAPISAYYFGTVSLVGLVTNLLCLWAISIAFYGIMLVCLVCRTVGAAAGVIAKLVAWLIRYALWVAETMADFPLAAVFTASPYITAWMVFLYVLLVLFLISKNRKPRIFACCAVIGLCLALTADWVESSADDVRITVLDVGQGQCILLQSEGRSFLVDCGGTYGDEAADQASEALLRQGIGKLDGLILTHLDQDHSNGVKGLLSRVETELLILPETYSELPVLTEAQLICVRETIDITFENTAIHVYPATFPGNDNEKSLCVLFDTEKCDILITGDRDAYGERSLLRNETIPDVDILIAGHHGAASSTCEELLEAVKPEIVCISAGAGNFYGHPAPELLQRLEEYGCHIYRTDVQGSITIRR